MSIDIFGALMEKFRQHTNFLEVIITINKICYGDYYKINVYNRGYENDELIASGDGCSLLAACKEAEIFYEKYLENMGCRFNESKYKN